MKRSARWIVGSAATAGLLLAGNGTAFADADPPGSNSAGSNSTSVICTQRIPAVLARIDRLTERITGDAGTRGSTAWLEAKSAQARDAGFTALADLLETRVEARPERLDELAALRSDVQDVQTKDCAA